MDINKLKDTLKLLQTSLETSGKVDSELKQLLEVLDRDIHLLLGKETPDSSSVAGLVERARIISVKFATKHPHIEPLLREVVDILTAMGV
jgi:hypothetical protein